MKISAAANLDISILYPKDWGRIKTSSFTAAISGIQGGGYECRIWRFEEFSQEFAWLATAEAFPHSSGFWIAQFTSIEAWGKCVLGVVRMEGQEIVACHGIQISFSDETRLLQTFNTATSNERLSFPLPITFNELSNISTGDQIIPCRIISKELFYTSDRAISDGEIIFHVLSEAEQHDARSCMLVEYCLGTEDECFITYYNKSEWSSARHYAAIFFDADLYVATGLPISKQGIWGDSAFASLYHDTVMAHYPEVFRFNNAIGRVASGTFVKTKDQRLAFMLGNAGFGNIAHWIMNSLMAAYMMKDEIVRHDMILVSPILPSYARESMRLLGLGDRLYETQELQLSFSKVVYTSYLSTHFNMMPASSVLQMVFELKALAVDDPSFSQMAAHELLFLSRRGAPSTRNFHNEIAFVRELRQLGFKEVATHDLTFVQKIRVMSKARIIIAQLGAALSHIAFAPKGCVVIEITTKSFHSNEYWYLSRLLGLRFVRFIGKERSETYIDWKCFDFEIDIDLAINKIRCILDEDHGKKPKADDLLDPKIVA